uniref:Spastic paraplegia 11 n=1 Tax=Nothobranchius pienaari TaxID=704102 RepID=A0A1A8MPB2_9TELE
MVNWDWLLQLQWQQDEEEPKVLSCCGVQLSSTDRQTAVHHCVCAETLFILSAVGFISIHSITDGLLLATIDLPAYLTPGLAEGHATFCLVQVSADLSTAVAVTQSHTAVAIDLNHYFRTYPDHLLCPVPQSSLPLQPKISRDQDSMSSSSCSLAALGSPFSDDRSWEARLSSMYNQAQKSAAPSSSPLPAGTFWTSSLLHLHSHLAPASGHSKAPPGGTMAVFSVPECSTPSLLAVSEFSALLTFVTPENNQTTVALWDVESGHMGYKESNNEEVLKEIVEQRQLEKVEELWRNLRLDWVKNWDESCQAAILLSRLKPTELGGCDSSVLWRHLTGLHDQQQVCEWIQTQRPTSSPCWPDISPELVNNNTMCSIYMKESILDLLARKGIFIPEEMSDLELLLWRMSQDPGLVFQASLTGAQVLLPGGQASLSSLLLEGHSLLALAAAMFAPGGIDQVVAQGQRSCTKDRRVDPQLLKMALASHPKLRAALFPAGSCGNDISIYHLLQCLHPLDPSRLFGWQLSNTLNSVETSELPHFSCPHLVSKFALVENLDFLYYIQHGRPSFAYGNFLVQQLRACSDVKLLLKQAWQQVYKLVLKYFNVPSVTSAAVCFCELLGICSLKLRVDTRALNTILQHWNQQDTHNPVQHLRTLAVKMVEAESGAAEELIGYLEAAVKESLELRGIYRSSYEAAQEWVLPVQFCQLHGLKLSSVYPLHCAKDRQLIYFLVFIQLHTFPPQQVSSLVSQFDPTLQTHLSLAFQDLQVHTERRGCSPEEQSGSLRRKESYSSPEHPREVFQVLLQSQVEMVPCRYLLHEALVQHCPVLTVLAACLQRTELLPCLCVWVLTSVDAATAEQATSHLIEAPQDHEWTLHDLSIIWRTLLGRGHVRPLLRGFELFQRDCPLVLVLRMFELCYDYRKFTEAKTKLLDFQRTLITLRNGGPVPCGSLPLAWVESQASVLLLIMLQHCSSQYDLHHLLQLLADVDKLLKSNGPDFKKLSQLSQLLQGSGISLPPRLLQYSSTSVQQEEFQLIVDALQTRGLYSRARQVALLAGLPVHRLLLNQLSQEAIIQRTKQQWRRLDTRVTFWKKCHKQLKAESTDPESVSGFFLSQSESVATKAPTGEEAQAELLDLQERSLLLQLTAHFLSQLSPVPLDKLQSLEKRLWLSRVQNHTLTATVAKDSMFNLPPAITSETNAYEVFMREFSFSNIADLNTDKDLSLEGLPGPSMEQETLNVGPKLSPEEREVLSELVSQLLDEGSVHEASRVSRYFSLYHPDVWGALQCHALACGDLSPEAQEKTPEAPTRETIPASSSHSSLSSFVMLLPEDTVSAQLQTLVDQRQHGSSYCKQVLSLYQLSKELQYTFHQICKEEPGSVLEKLLLLEQPDRFRKAQTFIQARGLSSEAVAKLVSTSVVRALSASTQELQPGEKQVFRPSEGPDPWVQLIKLCGDPNSVGLKLLEDLNAVPLWDLNCIVELLIVAHSCFSLTCNMEGIIRVLQAARHLSHTYLAPGEHHGLLVRLLTGIGRYNEMTYIFDLLHQNHCFEMLLRKKVEIERGQSSSLKTALLDYIKRCLPADSEKHNMVALCFSMRREIGENHEMAARTQLKMIESQAWVVTPELKASLVKVLGLLKDAAESFSKDSCMRQASRCVQTAKLVTLQLHLLDRGSDLRIVNLRPAEIQSAVTALPRCYQVFVVSEAYGYSLDWADILFQKVVLKGDFVYLEDLKLHRPLTSGLFEDIFRKLDGAPGTNTTNVKRLLTYCDDVYTRYRLAYQQKLYDITKMLLQDNKTSNYLNDKLARQ